VEHALEKRDIPWNKKKKKKHKHPIFLTAKLAQ
jgi:hypothetical protein